jgi:CheY-like chemotaxis protein
MVHLMRVSISKKATLNCELSDRLPVIEGDSGHISQVVLNLITNASEALGEKPGSITVRTGTIAVDHAYLSETFLHEDLAEGPYVFLEVSDTGSGMDEGTRSKIFDPFFSTKFTGRGLGLAVLLGIVRAHRGAIRVDSRIGEGTTFRVIFPPTEEALPVQPDAAPTPNSWEGSGTVLVVDDEADVRDVVGAMAPRFGLTVVTARNGREAVELFRSGSRNIVAVLLDMTMPEMNGEEAFSALRQIRHDVPVLMMTGYSERYALSRFPETSGLRILKKPFTMERLRGTLQELLERQPTE